jgi:hypothetical protein
MILLFYMPFSKRIHFKPTSIHSLSDLFICIILGIMCRSLLGYVIPMIPCLLYCVYYGGFLIQFLIEKMGMMGSLPKPFG